MRGMAQAVRFNPCEGLRVIVGHHEETCSTKSSSFNPCEGLRVIVGHDWQAVRTLATVSIPVRV